MLSNRPIVTDDEVNRSIDMAIAKIFQKIKEYGPHAMSSKHEIQGLLKEEWDEFSEAIHGGTSEEVKAELLDMAVVAIFGHACIEAKKVDW